MRSPLTRKRRVTRKNQPRRNVPLRTQKQRAPAPLFGPLDQVCAQGIAFDVPHHRQQVLVVLDRKGLEPALIEMSCASGSVVSVRPHGVRHREPAKELTDLPVTGRSHDEVPVIGHRRKGENGKRNLRPCLVQDAQKRIVVSRLLENRHPSHGPVQDMEHFIRRADAAGSGHRRTLPHENMKTPTKRVLTPFSRFLSRSQRHVRRKEQRRRQLSEEFRRDARLSLSRQTGTTDSGDRLRSGRNCQRLEGPGLHSEQRREATDRRQVFHEGSLERRHHSAAASRMGRRFAGRKDSRRHSQFRRSRQSKVLANQTGESPQGNAAAWTTRGQVHAPLPNSRRERPRSANASPFPKIRPRRHRAGHDRRQSIIKRYQPPGGEVRATTLERSQLELRQDMAHSASPLRADELFAAQGELSCGSVEGMKPSQSARSYPLIPWES